MDDLTRLPGEASSGTLTSSGAEWGRFAPGTVFAGRFRIVAPLGRGGMGEVYRADDLKLGQTVALKFLPDSVTHDPARLAQFHNEVRVARTISHRNVCRTYDIGDADGRPFLTMEYVDGEDLALLRRIGRFPQEKAVEVARQICAGVAAAHHRGVLHRDLKPANVMIDGDGHVRITDFGLAAIAGRVDNIRSGTPAYMAPEQLAGREVTARSDIYALGLILFELFTGRRVFEADTLNELIRLHESGAIANASSVVRDLDPTIERAIQRCLERNPANRPPSALAVSAVMVVASQNGRDGSVVMRQDVDIFPCRMQKAESAFWCYSRGGTNGCKCCADASSSTASRSLKATEHLVADEAALEVRSSSVSETLLFDLA